MLRVVVPVVCAGLAAALAASIDMFWPLGLVAFAPLLWVTRDLSPWRAALAWFAAIFLAMCCACYWWTPTLIRFADLSMPSAFGLHLLLCAWQAVPYGIWALLASWLVQNKKLDPLWVFPLTIVPIEALWPFFFKMSLAITIVPFGSMIQSAELGGPAVVTGLLMLVNFSLARLFVLFRAKTELVKAEKITMIVALALMILGFVRSLQVNYTARQGEKMVVGLLQSNFGGNSMEHRKRYGADQVTTLRQKTEELHKRGAELIIWPESAWPYLMDRTMKKEFPKGHPWNLRGKADSRLIVGALTHTFGGTKVNNTAVLVSRDGNIAGRHDKTMLVPFAETIPFESRYPERAKALRERLPEWPEIAMGGQPKLLEDGDLRIGALICSEDLHPNFVAALAEDEPNLWVSIASDAWFGKTVAARQHLALSTFRAVETRRPLARAANNGISALIDASGRIQARLRLQDPEVEVAPEIVAGPLFLGRVLTPGPFLVTWTPRIFLIVLVFLAFIRLRPGSPAQP